MGKLHSVLPDGSDLSSHSNHNGYYVRYPMSDGNRIVYGAGADLWVYDPNAGESRRIDVEFHSPRGQLRRRFVEADTRFIQVNWPKVANSDLHSWRYWEYNEYHHFDQSAHAQSDNLYFNFLNRS